MIRYSFLKTSYLIKRFGVFNRTQLVGHKPTVVITHVIPFAKASLYQLPHKINDIEKHDCNNKTASETKTRPHASRVNLKAREKLKVQGYTTSAYFIN